MFESPVKRRHPVRCQYCFHLLEEKSRACGYCGTEVVTDRPKTLFGRVKRLFGIELSSEIISIDLADSERFFTAQEIEMLLKMENLVVLSLEEVPDYATMFYQSKRVRRPLREKNA